MCLLLVGVMVFVLNVVVAIIYCNILYLLFIVFYYYFLNGFNVYFYGELFVYGGLCLG